MNLPAPLAKEKPTPIKTNILAEVLADSSKVGVNITASEMKNAKYLRTLSQSVSSVYLNIVCRIGTMMATGIANQAAR